MTTLSSCCSPIAGCLPGCSSKLLDQSFVKFSPMSLSLLPIRHSKSELATSKHRVIVRAGLSDTGKPSSASIFVGGFVLGGIIVGTLGCVYAPQISKALAGANKKDLMRKLPNFIYNEEKALEKTRKVLEKKIAQLNLAIDDISSELRADNAPNGAVVSSDEIEAAI
ncbi:uncharacterized protein M6B38_159730 [Iris pallida]|uniref:Inner membrane localized protein n=1 Tax=Iris pallida TaxID=29817 RepID=A0AAX6F139_IRIPA|nr:Uncharacterized protein M6B38_240230 [Iris pallida]KAJ6809891.1 uncharacterized protein M6B38_159730 [Iris pallida]